VVLPAWGNTSQHLHRASASYLLWVFQLFCELHFIPFHRTSGSYLCHGYTLHTISTEPVVPIIPAHVGYTVNTTLTELVIPNCLGFTHSLIHSSTHVYKDFVTNSTLMPLGVNMAADTAHPLTQYLPPTLTGYWQVLRVIHFISPLQKQNEKNKYPNLERRFLLHGGAFPSSPIPCLMSTASVPLAIPSTPRTRFSPKGHLFTYRRH
jgi:hypothetical protein